MKRKIVMLMVVTKDKGITSTTSLERSNFRFRVSKKIMGILNENFPLAIMDITSNFDVSMLLIDDIISCDIVYFDLFKNNGLEKGKTVALRRVYL